MKTSQIKEGVFCVVKATTQDTPAIGHNSTETPALFGLRAKWLRYTKETELRRLAMLHLRIERKKHALAVLRQERDTIMNRCVRRMRREAGKN